MPTFGFREPEINELCAFWPRVAEVGPAHATPPPLGVAAHHRPAHRPPHPGAAALQNGCEAPIPPPPPTAYTVGRDISYDRVLSHALRHVVPVASRSATLTGSRPRCAGTAGTCGRKVSHWEVTCGRIRSREDGRKSDRAAGHSASTSLGRAAHVEGKRTARIDNRDHPYVGLERAESPRSPIVTRTPWGPLYGSGADSWRPERGVPTAHTPAGSGTPTDGPGRTRTRAGRGFVSRSPHRRVREGDCTGHRADHRPASCAESSWHSMIPSLTPVAYPSE